LSLWILISRVNLVSHAKSTNLLTGFQQEFPCTIKLDT